MNLCSMFFLFVGMSRSELISELQGMQSEEMKERDASLITLVQEYIRIYGKRSRKPSSLYKEKVSTPN